MKTMTSNQTLHFQALEEAKEAVVRLRTLRRFLTRADEETLSILIDQNLLSHLSQSMTEAKKGKIRPLKEILS